MKLGKKRARLGWARGGWVGGLQNSDLENCFFWRSVEAGMRTSTTEVHSLERFKFGSHQLTSDLKIVSAFDFDFCTEI